MGAPDPPSSEDIFMDPEHVLARPNEALLKLAFNENGDLGLITDYQDIGGQPVFTGISATDNAVWVSQSPLTLRAKLDPDALTNMGEVVRAITPPRSPIRPQIQQDAVFIGHDFGGGSLPESTLRNIFKALGNIHKQHDPQAENGPTKEYFGFPDIQGPNNIKFDMQQFMDAFDAGSPKDDADFNDDEDNLYPFDTDDDPDNLV